MLDSSLVSVARKGVWTALVAAVVCAVGLLAGAGSALAEEAKFTETGKEQEFKVPAGVTSVLVTAIGAKGGESFSGVSGGFGGLVSARLSVTPGHTLYVEVGSNGGVFGGGGAGGGSSGSGGGASDVREKPASTEEPAHKESLESRLLVAGGGGGGGQIGSATSGARIGGGPGGNGDAEALGAGGAGENGASYSALGEGGEGGRGATTSEGGKGGKGGFGQAIPGHSGEAGALGAGGSTLAGGGGGGGGGGLYGGGQGGEGGCSVAGCEDEGGAGGGGAGSSFVAPSGTNPTFGKDTTGKPEVNISYTSPLPTSRKQCREGGWKNFGTTFKNHGQCVRFVVTGRLEAGTTHTHH